SSVAGLRQYGTSFSLSLQTLWGRLVEAEGNVVGGRAILRLKEVGGVKRELADLQVRFQKHADENEALRTLIEALPYPIWMRDEADRLVFANGAYLGAIEAKDSVDAAQRGIDLFDRAAREELARAHAKTKPFAGRLPAIVAGARRSLDVHVFPSRHGS